MRVSPSYDMELLHFLSKLYIHVTHVWEIYNVKEGVERVARVTNDPLLSLGVRVSPVITGIQSSPKTFAKKENRK